MINFLLFNFKMKIMMQFKLLGDGEVVVLLHGFLENGKMWKAFSKDLSRNYRLIIPDLYGHGATRSVSDEHSMETQAQGVLEILDDLEISSASFIGHSMGGYISLAIARDFPERVDKLGLFFSSSLPDSEEKKAQRLKAVETATENKEGFIHHGVKNLFNQNNLDQLRKEIEKARKWALKMPLNGVTAALKGMRLRQDTTKVLENSEFPIQIVLGEFDPAIDLESFQKVIPQKENIEVSVLPVGHMGHLEAPKESLRIIKKFLSQK